jgi:hypothetical protein
MASQALPRSPLNKGAKAKPQPGTPAKLGAGKMKGQEQRQQVNQEQHRASGSGTSPMPSEGDNVSPYLGGTAGTAEKASGRIPGGKAWNAVNDLRGGAHKFKEKIKSYGADAPTKPGDLAANAPSSLPMNLSDLEGLEVGDGGQIMDHNGTPVAKVVEGDPEDLVGMSVGADGEILDEDGDLVGRVQILSKPTEALEEGTANIGETPSLETLKDLPVTEEGYVMDHAGQQPMAKVVEGDTGSLVGRTANEHGEIYDEDENLIGRLEALSPDEAAKAIGQQAEGAKEHAGEIGEAIPAKISNISILEGRRVNKKGKVLDEEGEVLGQVVGDQDPKALAGNHINEKGQILDDANNVIGEVEIVPGEAADDAIKVLQQKQGETRESTQEEPDVSTLKDEVEGEVADETSAIGEDAAAKGEQLPDISTLEGLKCNKLGSIVNADGIPVGELVEGDPKRLCRDNIQLDDQGQFWDGRGNVIGKAQPLPVEETPPGPFADLEDVFVAEDGWVQDANGRRVGQVTEGDNKKLIGRAVDTDGDILDKRGNIIGHAEPWEEPEEPEPEKVDLSMLEGFKPNKYGNVMGSSGVPIARVVDGDLKTVSGRPIDREGQIWGDSGEVIGHVTIIPENERESRGPFSGLGDLVVNGEGFVEDVDGMVVGRIIEGDPKSLRGQAVDTDGEILDEHGNVQGRAERYEPPEESVVEEDLSALEGKTVNKLGNIVDANGVVIGRIASGYIKHLVGKQVDDKGQIFNEKGKVIGQAELIPNNEQERPEGPFYGLEGLTLGKDGMVVNPEQEVVGRLVEGDQKRLEGRAVDEDGEILDKTGNVIGRAERWTPEEKQRDISPMAGRKVNKEGEVRDEDGNLLGKLTQGDLQNLRGKLIDSNGYVVDNDGNKIGECTLLENLPDEQPTMSPEELEKQEKEKQDRELAKKMCAILQDTLDSVQPLCKQIMQVRSLFHLVSFRYVNVFLSQEH